MKINNRNKINSTRIAIGQLIDVLNSDIVITDEDKGSEIKSVMQTKKNAFMRAKYLLGRLQALETADAKEIKIEWYDSNIRALISAAENAMGELSKSMKEVIDTSDKGASINASIASKQEALDHMDDLHRGVYELEGIITSIESGDGLKDLKDADFKASYAEDFSYEGFYKPIRGKYQAGYNKDLDAVVISYDGTIGDIIECYGLRIALPKKPAKKTLFNYRKKKADQYWQRQPYPYGLTKETASIHIDYIEEEFRRRDEGFWFLNNGEMEYITGAQYMLLQHCKTDAIGGYFHYRKAHRDLFYWLEAAWVDNRSLGVMLGKTRRTGATYCAVAFQLTKAISISSSLFGMTSKKDKDAKAVFAKEVNMFKNLPFFFKPINTGENPASKLSFSIPSKKTTKNSKEVDYNELDTHIDFESTVEDAYDGLALKFYIVDEFSKWKAGNTLTHWSMVRKTLLEGVNLKGKAFVLSTVENVTGADGYDDDAKCGDRFRTLYEESRLSTRGENGRTTSGLYSIFISALDNYGGCIDKYGNCHSTTPEKPTYGADGKLIEQGVREAVEAILKPFKDNPAKLNDEKRKDPFTEDDMFRIASEDSLFNVTKIQDQIDYNNNWELDHGRPPYKTGNFRYKDSTQDVVEFIETPTGRFHVSWLPDEAMANKHTVRGGDIAPSYTNVGIFGIDPYKLNKVKSGSKGSKGAIVGYLMNHPIDGIPKEEFFLVYVNRPQSVDIFIEDAIMAMKYYSMPALIESNIIETVKVLHRRGLTRFSMRRPDVNKLAPDERIYGGIPSTDPKLIMNQAFFLEKYIEDHVGYPSDSEEFREFGEIGNCKFNELLTEFLQFDINNRTKYDATVAACLAVFGAQKYLLKNMRNKVVSNKTSIWNFNNQPKRIRNELQNA